MKLGIRVHSLQLLFSIVVLLFILSTELLAIPAFARKYKTSCSTCHESITKRNAFGESFRRVGYYIPVDDLQKIKERPVSLGADEWKELWPEAVWPGSLPPSFPLSLYSQMRINKQFETQNSSSNTSFSMPRDLVLLFGGAFGEGVAFFGQWAAYLDGKNAVGLFRFFFQFNSIFGEKSLINARVGRFEPGITDGYTGSQKLTLSFPSTLSFDPSGGWTPRTAQSGIELNGIYKSRIYYAAGIVNGEGKTTDDPTDRKDIYGRIAYQFGGTGFDGRDTSLVYNNDAAYEQFANAGVYAYSGSRNNLASPSGIYNSQFSRIGFDFLYHINKFDILLGVISGQDENPFNTKQNSKSLASFVELNYKIYPWLFGVLRVESVKSWLPDQDKHNHYDIIPNITILQRANIRFSVEGLIRIAGELENNGVTAAPDNSKPFQFVTINSLIAF